MFQVFCVFVCLCASHLFASAQIVSKYSGSFGQENKIIQLTVPATYSVVIATTATYSFSISIGRAYTPLEADSIVYNNVTNLWSAGLTVASCDLPIGGQISIVLQCEDLRDDGSFDTCSNPPLMINYTAVVTYIVFQMGQLDTTVSRSVLLPFFGGTPSHPVSVKFSTPSFSSNTANVVLAQLTILRTDVHDTILVHSNITSNTNSLAFEFKTITTGECDPRTTNPTLVTEATGSLLSGSVDRNGNWAGLLLKSQTEYQLLLGPSVTTKSILLTLSLISTPTTINSGANCSIQIWAIFLSLLGGLLVGGLIVFCIMKRKNFYGSL